MQRKDTRDLHIQIANKTMTYIYKHIDTSINIDELADTFKISKKHLHQIFKEQLDINIYESIKSIRLQKASNLLLTNKYSTITEIANMCGYSSQSSFIKAFKERFEKTPKQWRNGGYEIYSDTILKDSLLKDSLPNFDESKVRIVKVQDKQIYYIRQKGYIVEEAKQKWQQLQAWTYTNELKDDEYEQIGIYHDNPAITPHHKCFYIAAISPKRKIEDTNIPSNTLKGGIYATFDIYSGDEAAWFIKWVYHKWLPNSGFETTTEPSFVIMHKNHFLDDNEIDATFYLPIRRV